MLLTSTSWLVLKKGSVEIERTENILSLLRNAETLPAKQIINLEALHTLNKTTDQLEQNEKDDREIDPKEELKKIMGLSVSS